MRLIKRISEGESWTAAIIGWKIMTYRSYVDEAKEQKSLRVSLYLGFMLCKFEFIWL